MKKKMLQSYGGWRVVAKDTVVET